MAVPLEVVVALGVVVVVERMLNTFSAIPGRESISARNVEGKRENEP